MKHNTRLSWTVALAIAAPVMALTGCPGLIGGNPTGASPTPGTATSPTPAPTPTPALRNTVVLTKVSFPTTVASRSFTVKNLGSAEADLAKWVVSYEYDDAGTLKMQHLRFGNGKKLAAGAEHTVFDVACTGTNTECVTKEDGLGGTGATTMGIQVGAGGSLVIYKGISAPADLTNANMVDYMQYGSTAKNYTHAAAAVANKFWEATGSLAPAAVVDKALQVKTAGATGSVNWELK